MLSQHATLATLHAATKSVYGWVEDTAKEVVDNPYIIQIKDGVLTRSSTFPMSSINKWTVALERMIYPSP